MTGTNVSRVMTLRFLLNLMLFHSHYDMLQSLYYNPNLFCAGMVVPDFLVSRVESLASRWKFSSWDTFRGLIFMSRILLLMQFEATQYKRTFLCFSFPTFLPWRHQWAKCSLLCHFCFFWCRNAWNKKWYVTVALHERCDCVTELVTYLLVTLFVSTLSIFWHTKA
jgi:hypothetical protein